MAPKELINRPIEAGREASERAADRIESLVGELQRISDRQSEQVRAMVADVIERTRDTFDQLVSTDDQELRRQVAALGLATQADIQRLEDKIEKLSAPKRTTRKATKTAAKKTGAKKTAAKKTAAKKSASEKLPSKKVSAKKASAKKSATGSS